MYRDHFCAGNTQRAAPRGNTMSEDEAITNIRVTSMRNLHDDRVAGLTMSDHILSLYTAVFVRPIESYLGSGLLLAGIYCYDMAVHSILVRVR